jgi:hypothetical protein
LEKEFSEIDISCSNHIQETWHHMGNVWNTFYSQGLEDECNSLPT